MKKKTCEVTDCTKKCPTCGNDWDSWVCGKKGVSKIRVANWKPEYKGDSNKPFWVCREHKKEFLMGNHYEIVAKGNRKNRRLLL